MTSVPTIDWTGQSGRTYRYWIYPIDQLFTDGAGNYIFAKEVQQGRWTPCYIGQTSNLSDRLSDHEKEMCARRHGATHIHAHANPAGESTRRAEEADLISRWDPPCNVQLINRG